MTVLGVVAEYNPFHNGHLYHFNTSLDLTQAEYSVCALSGSFMQRGEPAIVDKWSRTLMALNAGFDLVIEIPVIYCAQSAEFFALGSISLLNKMGIVDTLCFGSESGNMEMLNLIGDIIEREPEEYKYYLKSELKKGVSFASARAGAISKYVSMHFDNKIDMDGIEDFLKSSNNILGMEYIKWLKRLNSPIKPVTLCRMHTQYNDKTLDKPMASATALRHAVQSGNFESLRVHMPEFALKIMTEQFEKGCGPVFIQDFGQAILCTVRRMKAEEIAEIADVSEGLENKIKAAALSCSSIDELISQIKSKRYAESRIKRILVNILLGIQKKVLLLFRESGPQYIRVLGFSDKGKKLLSIMKDTCPLPVISNTADYRKYDMPLLKRMIEMDILSTDIYVTAYKKSSHMAGALDFYKKPVKL